jgi:hypothetical protein
MRRTVLSLLSILAASACLPAATLTLIGPAAGDSLDYGDSMRMISGSTLPATSMRIPDWKNAL